MLAAVLHTRSEVRTLDPYYGGADGPGTDGRTRENSALDSHAPDGPAPASSSPDGSAHPEPGRPTTVTTGTGVHLGYRSDVIEVVETYLYRPLVRPLMMLVRAAKRLQSGRLDAYLAYMLITLIALIAIVAALA